MNTMQSFEAVLQALPSGGVVRYNTYRHADVSRGLNSGTPYTTNEALRPFVGLVVILTAPEAYDPEEGFWHDEKNEVPLCVVKYHSLEFDKILTAAREMPGFSVTWRFLCEPLA